jgi:hypothetical protein
VRQESARVSPAPTNQDSKRTTMSSSSMADNPKLDNTNRTRKTPESQEDSQTQVSEGLSQQYADLLGRENSTGSDGSMKSTQRKTNKRMKIQD